MIKIRYIHDDGIDWYCAKMASYKHKHEEERVEFIEFYTNEKYTITLKDDDQINIDGEFIDAG